MLLRPPLIVLSTACLLAIACASGEGRPKSAPKIPSVVLPEDPDNPEGRAVYIKNCKLCHGVDGQMGGSGAANLAVSLLSTEEAIGVITKGRKLMSAYEDKLSPEEIESVAHYIQLFKAN